MRLDNKVAIVTGGSSGIGKSIAKKCLQNNNKVIITGRSEDKLTETKKAIKAKINVSQKPEINPAIIAPIIEPKIVGISQDFKTV